MADKPTREEIKNKLRELALTDFEQKDLLKSLLMEEETYRHLFENMLHEVHIWEVIYDEHGSIKTWKLVDANPGALRSWGKSLSTIIGKTTDEIFPDSNATELFMPIVKKIFEEGTPHEWEVYFPATDQFLHMISIPFKNFFISTGLDVTQHKRNEIYLKQSLEMHKRTEAIAHIGSWEWDIQKDSVFWSEEMFRIFQRDPSEGAPSYAEHPSFYAAEDMQRLDNAVQLCISEGTPYALELRIIRTDGDIRYCVARGQSQTDENGEIARLVGSLQDITERKVMEDNLRKSEARYRGVVEDQTEIISRFQIDGTFTWVNEFSAQYIGKTVDELIGSSFMDFLSPEEQVKVRENLDQITVDNPVLESTQQFRLPNGETRYLQWRNRGIFDKHGEVVEFQGVGRDITERKAAEEALNEALLRQQEAVKAGNVGLWDWDLETNNVRYSAEWKRQIGYEEDEIGDNFDEWESRVHPDDLSRILGRIKQYIRDRASAYKVEFRFRHKDGSYRWILAQASVLTDENGEPYRVLGSHIDITEHKTVEEALRESEERFSKIFEMSLDLICIADINTTSFLTVNPSFKRVLGYEQHELVGRSFLEFIHPEDVDKTKTIVETHLKKGLFVIEFENRYRHKKGFYLTLDWVSHPLLEKGVTYAIARDITERKKAELALRESEHRVRTKLNALLDPEGDLGMLNLADVMDCDEIQSLMDDFHALTDIGIGILDLDGNILVRTGWQDVCTKFHRVHPETEKLCRESDSKLTSGVELGTFEIYKCKNNLWDMVTPIMVGGKHVGNLFLGQFFIEDETPDIATFREQARRYKFDEEAYLKAYHAIPRWSRETIDRVMTFYCNLINVISRLSYAHIKLAQTTEALRRSEGKFRALIENTIDWIWETGANGTYTYASENAYELLGYTNVELLGRTPFDLMDNEEADRVRSIFQDVAQKYDRILHLEDTLLHKDGHPVIFETNATPLIDENGDLLGYFGTCRDITESKQAEDALRKIEKRYRSLVDHSPVCHKIVDLDFNLQYMSANGFRMLKLEITNEYYGKPYPFDFFPKLAYEKMVDALSTVKASGKIMDFESQASDAEGNTVWLHHTIIPVFTDDNIINFITVVSADITEQKQAEEERVRLNTQLQQAQKMEAVGRLAGGVAHDFNNMLGVIIGNVDLILMEMEPDHLLYDDLMEIKQAGKRSADLTRQLLAFARKQTVAPKVIDLDKTIAGMLKMLQRLIGEDIDMAWIPSGKVWPVKIDPGQIDQILANLCVNARDAITGVGKVTIETGNAVFNEDYCKVHAGFAPGEYVMLAVSDNGCGMDSETLTQVFEPFFTTKELGKGTGLGLATVYGVVKQNNGLINVYSELGQGTTFKIYLPRYNAKPASLLDKEPGKPSQPGRETILLVEDEPSIMKITTKMLAQQGYTVVGASRPGEAIRLAIEHEGDIQLLMTDVVMPEMNGRDLAKNILSLYPGVKCLFMSGYTANVIAHHGVLDEGVNFIQKPFLIEDLTVKLREVLDQK